MFTIAIAGASAIIALFAGYVQKAKSLEKVTHRVEAVTVHSGDVLRQVNF